MADYDHKKNRKSAQAAFLRDDPAPDDPSAGGLLAAMREANADLDDVDPTAETDDGDVDNGDADDGGEQDDVPADDEPAAEADDAATDDPSPAPPGGGSLATLCGCLFLTGGVATVVLQAQSQLPAALATYGVQPATLFSVGAVVLGIGLVRRQLRRLHDLTRQQHGTHAELQSSLQFLVEHQQAAAEKPPAEGEELERVLGALQRQDDKLLNLTKALKMYGKPLMEIASSSSDVVGQVAQLKTQADTLLETMQQGLQRADAASGSGAASDEALAALREQAENFEANVQRGFAALAESSSGTGTANEEALAALREQAQQFEEQVLRNLAALAEKMPAGALQQQLTRVEASVQAVSQRLDDSEIRKSLMRLEDAEKKLGRRLDELAPAEQLRTDREKLERQIDNGLGKLNKAVEQLRDHNVSGLESTVREIQREVAGLATAVSQIQQAVKAGAMRAAPMPSSMPSPAAAPAAPAAASPPPPPPMAAAPASPPSPKFANTPAPAAPAAPVNTAGLSDAQAGAAQNQTGTRASSGKNVLGAIAKLKKMKN